MENLDTFTAKTARQIQGKHQHTPLKNVLRKIRKAAIDDKSILYLNGTISAVSHAELEKRGFEVTHVTYALKTEIRW